MGLFDLGKRLWDITREQGKILWDEVSPEIGEGNPQWDSIKSELRNRGYDLRRQMQAEMRFWLEEELRRQQIQWQSLLGQDPELEKAYALLGLPYGTEMNTVKQTWRNMLKESHPDLHMQNPEAHTRATQRSQSLTAAYHQISKAFEEGRL
jgi:DnaJ-domain-containing protein 1